MKLLDEISDVSARSMIMPKEHRLKIVSDLSSTHARHMAEVLKGAFDIDGLIKDAVKLSRFVERGEAKTTHAPEITMRPSGKSPKPKRPYVKRSKFWKKK